MVYAKSKVMFSRSAAQDRMVAQMFIFLFLLLSSIKPKKITEVLSMLSSGGLLLCRSNKPLKISESAGNGCYLGTKAER